MAVLNQVPYDDWQATQTRNTC